jgi:hypothetical protein
MPSQLLLLQHAEQGSGSGSLAELRSLRLRHWGRPEPWQALALTDKLDGKQQASCLTKVEQVAYTRLADKRYVEYPLHEEILGKYPAGNTFQYCHTRSGDRLRADFNAEGGARKANYA